MDEGGDTKDDVKLPDNEIGTKIDQLFKVQEKDTSKCSLGWRTSELESC